MIPEILIAETNTDPIKPVINEFIRSRNVEDNVQKMRLKIIKEACQFSP
jgi:ribosomal protein L31E